MSYRVFENGCRCRDFHIKTWDQDTFQTKREAEIHAYRWAYPVTRSTAEIQAPPMELNKAYNYSTCEFPVLMEIREVSDHE